MDRALKETPARNRTSTDGLNWQRVPNDETLVEKETMNSVTPLGDGLVAVGQSMTEWPSVSAAVWTSPDGHNWCRIPNDALFADGSIVAVTGFDSGLVAVGGGVWVATPTDNGFTPCAD